MTARALGLAAAGAGAAVMAVFIPTAVTATPAYHPVGTSAPATPTTSLTPNEQGYVRVTIAAQAIGCSVMTALVACETSSNGWPPRGDGTPFHTVSVSAEGELHFVNADLGALEGKVALSAGVYWAQGWTIAATTDAGTFTNDRTGHGMVVTPQAVQAF